MVDKFKNKYRIPSARLQNWDYGANGAYFITICTKNKIHFFGEIADEGMQMNEIGKLAEEFGGEIPSHFLFAELDAFVVMPNHIHGIVIIRTDAIHRVSNGISGGDGDTDAMNRVSTGVGGFAGNKNPMIHENISRIVRWYKGRCTFEIRKTHADFEWQTRFHEHIIRTGDSFERIREYVEKNPLNWEDDRFR
ncbi:MAG: transposase [Saprospirales bacterium]|nr:transposase [Saprospirales bacterium]